MKASWLDKTPWAINPNAPFWCHVVAAPLRPRTALLRRFVFEKIFHNETLQGALSTLDNMIPHEKKGNFDFRRKDNEVVGFITDLFDAVTSDEILAWLDESDRWEECENLRPDALTNLTGFPSL